MKNFLSFLSKHHHLILRLGLVFVFLYAGIDSLMDPQAWLGFVPQWMSAIMARETFLFIHGIGETLLGVLILFKVWPKLTYAAAAADMLAILVLYGIDDISFRDIGLFFLAAGLWAKELEKGASLQ